MNKTVKQLAGSLLYRSGLLHLYLKLIFLRRKEFGAVILYYHRFVRDRETAMDPHPSVTHLIDAFEAEVGFLKRYFDIISLDAAVATLKASRKFTRPAVVISVDDGYRDNFNLLYPVLRKHQIPAVIFLATGPIGTGDRLWVDDLARMVAETSSATVALEGLGTLSLEDFRQKRDAFKRIVEMLKGMDQDRRIEALRQLAGKLGKASAGERSMLTWEEVRTMHKGGVDFGAHTMTHPILSRVPLEKAREEIAGSKSRIERELGTTVRHFAYPNGRRQDMSEDLNRLCRNSGFESVSTTVAGRNASPADRFDLKRIGAEEPIELFALALVKAFLS